MSQEHLPGDRPEDPRREGEEPKGGEPESGFTPTDLSKLFDWNENPLPTGQQGFEGRPQTPEEVENRQPKKLYEKEVKVTAVYEQTTITGNRAYFVQLRDNAGRDIKVYVDYNQAASISMAIENVGFKRPLTHDLMRIIIERTGYRLDRILIDDLYNETFYAKISLEKGNEVIDIDCRPSDAIALALRCRAPIYAAEDVLASAAREDQSEEGGSPE